MPAGFAESDADEAALGCLQNPRHASRRGPQSRRRLFMHLDGDSIAERRQRCFEIDQPPGGPRVDQPRRLALVDVEAARKIGDSHLAGAQRAVEHRLQRDRRIGRDPVLAAAQAAGRRDVLAG